jgi:hypothetical protein
MAERLPVRDALISFAAREPLRAALFLTYSFDGRWFEDAIIADLCERPIATILIVRDRNAIASEAPSVRYRKANACSSAVFHPKLALLVADDRARAVISSANLTRGGFERQQELGRVFDLGPSEVAYHSFFANLVDYLESGIAREVRGDGRAKKATIDKENTTIVSGAEIEVKERKDDAMHADPCGGRGRHPAGRRCCSAARQRGAQEAAHAQRRPEDRRGDRPQRALRPARQIATNAGEDGSMIIGKILEKDQYNYGFDTQNGEYVNMMSKGIIDPTKVVRAALQNAASIAGLLITTEAMVAESAQEGQRGRGYAGWWHGRDGLLRPGISFQAFSRNALAGEVIFMTDSNKWYNPSEDYPPTRPWSSGISWCRRGARRRRSHVNWVAVSSFVHLPQIKADWGL